MRDGGAYGCAVPRAYANLNPGLHCVTAKTALACIASRGKNCDDMLSRFHLVPEHHGQTDGRTERQTDLLYQYRASVC